MGNSAVVNREYIGSSIEIAATPQAVWAIVSDLKRMGEWSPQCRKMFILGGEVGVGTLTININRQGFLFWPTRSKIKVFEPDRKLAFRILENGTIWTYELEPIEGGTRLTESRTAPHGVKTISNKLTNTVLGGTAGFEDDLLAGIEKTLQKIKTVAEAGVGTGTSA